MSEKERIEKLEKEVKDLQAELENVRKTCTPSTESVEVEEAPVAQESQVEPSYEEGYVSGEAEVNVTEGIELEGETSDSATKPKGSQRETSQGDKTE